MNIGKQNVSNLMIENPRTAFINAGVALSGIDGMFRELALHHRYSVHKRRPLVLHRDVFTWKESDYSFYTVTEVRTSLMERFLDMANPLLWKQIFTSMFNVALREQGTKPFAQGKRG